MAVKLIVKCMFKLIFLRQRSYILGSILSAFSVFYIGLLIYTALLPDINVGVGTPFLHFDKFLHFLGYMVLSFLLIQSFFHLFRIHKIKSFLVVLYISAFVGALTEVLQHYFTNGTRTAEVSDFIADVLGALSVFVLLLLKSKEKNQFAKHPK